MPPAPSAPVYSPATATTPESWTGPKAEAEKASDELGYPVMIDGALCRMKAEALDRIKSGGETVKVSRPAQDGAEAAPVKPVRSKQETKDGSGKEGRAPT